MKFKDLDNIINLPKEINYIIYKYSINICEDCNNEVEYCEDCKYYYCYCDNEITECYLCKKIFCKLIHEICYNVNLNSNLLLCNTCWNIDDWSRFREKDNKYIDKYN